jgi:hemolysin activation/secretion protein
MQRVIAWFCLLLPMLESPLLAAQPDAGQILRQQQPQRLLPEKASFPEPERTETVRPSASGIKIFVKSYRFTGFGALVQEHELQALVADATGRELSDRELDGLPARVDAFLKTKGWFLAESFLPEQEVTSGIIEIRLDPGGSDGFISFRKDKTVRLCTGVLSAIGNDAVQNGKAIDERKLERAMLLMNDLPGVVANADLKKGSVPGSTEVSVDVSEGPLMSGAVWEDNFGNYYTGWQRFSGMLDFSDPSGCGDRLTFMGNTSDGLRQGLIFYSYPLGSNGLKGTLDCSSMNYEMHKELSALDVMGQAQMLGAGLSYPLVRSRQSNVTATARIDRMILSDKILSNEIHDRTVNIVTMGLKGEYYDAFLGGGYNNWSAKVAMGSVDERITNVMLSDVPDTFSHVNLGLNRLQKVTGSVDLNLAWTAQLSPGDLDSSRKFCLGGPYGIRAYPLGEASGDAGQLINVDLRIKLPVPDDYGQVQLSGFYDAGRIITHINSQNYQIQTVSGKNSYWLQGAGAELTYIYSKCLSLKGSWAHVIGSNPGRDLSDLNSENKRDSDRFWLVTTVFF